MKINIYEGGWNGVCGELGESVCCVCTCVCVCVCVWGGVVEVKQEKCGADPVSLGHDTQVALT